MRPKKAHKQFSLFKKETKSGNVWYARYWDENTKHYAVTRSTGVLVEGKKERRYEAEQTSKKMLNQIRFSPVTSETFITYLEKFWTPDSPYVKEAALVKKLPLSAYYIKLNHEDVRRHIAPFPAFKEISLEKLTPAIIRDWLTWMAEKGLSGNTINHVLLAMRVAVRYAFAREEIDRDPFRNIGKAAAASKEKGILTRDEVARLIAAPVTDPRYRLSVLLGVLCGMRMGEVRGLKWGDISDGVINIRHNWQNMEGIKSPKCKGGAVRQNSRTVPLPSCVKKILEVLRITGTAPDYFVLESFQNKSEPVSKEYFRRVMDKELSTIGIPGTWKGNSEAPENYVNEQKKRNLTFHGLRHTYITPSRLAGITDLEIQALAGHRSEAMMQRYSHASQVLDFASAREKLEKALLTKAQ